MRNLDTGILTEERQVSGGVDVVDIVLGSRGGERGGEEVLASTSMISEIPNKHRCGGMLLVFVGVLRACVIVSGAMWLRLCCFLWLAGGCHKIPKIFK